MSPRRGSSFETLDGSSERAGAPSGEPIHILLIDDSADYLLLIRRELEKFDPRYRVTAVSSPEEAYALLDQQTFQLVLLDYKFPRGGNGLQVIRTLKGKSVFIPTVMVTAFGDEGIAIQAMREGALDFMPKHSDFLQALPEVAARAIERGRIIRERIHARAVLERRNKELQALTDIATAINVGREPDALLHVAEQRLASLLSSTASSVHLVDESGRFLTAHRGIRPGTPEDRLDLRTDETSLLVRAVQRGEVLVERDDMLGADRCVIPLVAQERTLGVLAFTLPAGRDVSPDDGALLASIGKQVGVALAHARLHHDLVRTEAYLKDLIDSAADEIVTVDPWGKVMSWNAGAQSIYGWSEDEMVGRDWEALWPSERRGDAALLLARVLERGETVSNFETVRLTKSGQPVDILLTLSPLRHGDGSIRGVSCVGKNVTFSRMLQAQLIQSEKMAAVGQLISGVAHELNNPLTGVIGYSQLISTSDTGEKLGTYLQRIAVEAGRCQRIVQNLLTFARRHEPKAARIDLNSVVRETVDLRGYDLRVSNVEIDVDLAPQLPTTLADAHQLQQVFVNLVNNAQQAMAKQPRTGRLAIRSRLEPTGLAGKPALVVSFGDSGPGVPAELRQKVFDPFFTTKGVGEGTGLGLSLSYGIVTEHGGRIDVGEAPEGGALFEVRLPVMPDLGLPDSAVVAAASASPEPPAPKRILVVDDQETIREMFSDILSRDGHEVLAVGGGREALELLLGGEEYDLIICDLRMPDFGGDRLYREVHRNLPVMADRMLFASGDVVSPDTRRFLERTGNRFLAKPCGVDEIRHTVSSFFAEQP